MSKPEQKALYSITKKIIMSLTGLFLILFLVEHLAGNLLLFAGPKAFNDYSEYMSHNIIIRAIEIFLFLAFIFHIINGLYLYFQNRAARGIGYKMHKFPFPVRLASRTMAYTGSILFIFLIIHLKSFFVPSRFGASYNGDMYSLVVNAFRNPIYWDFMF